MPPAKQIRIGDRFLWENLTEVQLLQVAEYAEQMEKFDDMRMAMRAFVTRRKGLSSLDERNLFVDAYKSVATSLRGQWRITASLSHQQTTDTLAEFSNTADGKKVSIKEQERMFALRRSQSKQVLMQIAKELKDVCEEAISIITDYLIPAPENKVEDNVYFHKIRADYYRYITETMEGEARKHWAEKTENAYMEANKKAVSLTAYNPVRMGLLLNLAVFHFEIYGNQTRAVRVARDAYDKCVSNMGKVPDEMLKDVKIIQDLLRDNLMLWCYTDDDNI